jgi:hypothetical protein
MAIAWSAYAQGNDGNGIRVGVDCYRLNATTVRVDYYFQTEFNYNDNQTLNKTGSATGTFNYLNNQAGGSQVLIQTVDIAASPGNTYTFGASISGVYNNANPSISASVTVPFDAPAAPGIPTATRNSDTSQTLTWTRNATAAAPYDSQQVQRADYDTGWGPWSTIATVAGSATTYTDTTTIAQRIYDYRVVSVNSAGSAIGASTSPEVYTTPKAPSGCAAAKSGANIVVSWTNGPNYASYQTEVYESAAGGAYTLLATVNNAVGSYTHVAPNAGQTHQYRVRHKTTTGPGNPLFSGYSTSSTVQLLAAPNAPTGLSPTTVRDAAAAIVLTWAHNPVDTTGQEQYQVRYRVLGGPTWTTPAAVTSGTSQHTLAANTFTNGQTIEWQVSTKGQAASFSPFSSSATIPTSATPTATVNTPANASTVATATTSVAWGYFQSGGSVQASWQVELLNGSGQVVESRSGVGTGTSTTLTTVLPNGTSWSVRVRVTSAAGLTSAWATSAFTVTYALPPTPTVAVTWQPTTASAQVTVTVPAPTGGQVPATSLDLFRSVDAGVTWQPVTLGVPYNGATPVTVTDYAPRVAGQTRWYADAVSATPSRASSTVQTLTTPQVGDPSPAPTVWLGAGPEFSQVARSGGEVTVARGGGLVKVLRSYAGRVLPVEHAGTQTARTWSVTAQVIEAPGGSMLAGSDPALWRALSYLPGPFLLRLADVDDWAFVSVSEVTVSSAVPAPHRHRRHQVSFTAVEVSR